MSTVFLKQHSVEDVIAACVVAVPLYLLVYRYDWTPVRQWWRERLAEREKMDLHR